jgi:hypothetical protein
LCNIAFFSGRPYAILVVEKWNKIKVHCWGGLGSQLFAWATAEQILQRYPKKNVVLVLHTGGVTKRKSDIDFLSNKFELVYKDDYKPIYNSQRTLLGKRQPIIRILKNLLSRVSLVYTSDDFTDIKNLKPWTLSIRGHYTNIFLPKEIIKLMITQIPDLKIYDSNFLDALSLNMGIHYRLGDLLELEDKTYIEPIRLVRQIKDLVSLIDFDTITLYSDDIKSAKKMLDKFLNFELIYCDKEIWETLIELCSSKYFIGTNSKISIWATLFRITLGTECQNYLPYAMKDNIEIIFPDIKNIKNIAYF